MYYELILTVKPSMTISFQNSVMKIQCGNSYSGQGDPAASGGPEVSSCVLSFCIYQQKRGILPASYDSVPEPALKVKKSIQ